MTEHDQVRLLLLELAAGCETADDVAAKLRVVGIDGWRRACRSCAVAQWLTHHGLERWEIGGLGEPVGCARKAFLRGWVHVELPSVLLLFAQRFDSGDYPDLEAA